MVRRGRPCLAAWPHALGFDEDDAASGLCIAFGWDGRRGLLGALRTERRNEFALVYEDAAAAGRALAMVLQHLAQCRPDCRIDFLTHSLGARIAMEAMRLRPELRMGRAILLAGAEYAGEAQALLHRQDREGGEAEFLHVLSRANAPYDALFELFAPRPTLRGDRALGTGGLRAEHPRWLDIQLDHPEMRPWLAARGFPLCRPPERFSHWHFYADPGAMAFWRAILRDPAQWGLGRLRDAGLTKMREPRWARLTRAGIPARPIEEVVGAAEEILQPSTLAGA